MTPDEIRAARRAAAALFATHAPAAHVVDCLFRALLDLERATVEVDRLRAIEAAGERLADIGRDLHFIHCGGPAAEDGDVWPYTELGAALYAWEAARRGDVAP